MTVAVVIPALDEESTIVEVIDAVTTIGRPIVVDDGSTDSTAQVAGAAGAHVVQHQSNLGYDRALASGIRAAIGLHATVIATVDADGEQVLEALAEAVVKVERGEAVVALGLRPAPARVSERLFGTYVRWRFGVPDILCGVKVYDAVFVVRHNDLLDRHTIGTGLALAALREGQPHVTFSVPVRPRRPSRFGSGLGPNLAIGRALIDGLLLDVSSRIRPGR